MLVYKNMLNGSLEYSAFFVYLCFIGDLTYIHYVLTNYLPHRKVYVKRDSFGFVEEGSGAKQRNKNKNGDGLIS
jgi:hypothetical protein